MARSPQSVETSLEKISEALQQIALQMQPKVFRQSNTIEKEKVRWFNSQTQQWELK